MRRILAIIFYMWVYKRLQGSHIWVAENHKPDFLTHEAALRNTPTLHVGFTVQFFYETAILSFQISADDAGALNFFSL